MRQRCLWLCAPKLRTRFVVFVLCKGSGYDRFALNICVCVLEFLACTMWSKRFTPLPGFAPRAPSKLRFEISERFYTTPDHTCHTFFANTIRDHLIGWLHLQGRTLTSVGQLFLSIARSKQEKVNAEPHALRVDGMVVVQAPVALAPKVCSKVADVLLNYVSVRSFAKSFLEEFPASAHPGNERAAQGYEPPPGWPPIPKGNVRVPAIRTYTSAQSSDCPKKGSKNISGPDGGPPAEAFYLLEYIETHCSHRINEWLYFEEQRRML